MKFKLLNDAPYVGKKGDIVEIDRKDYITILKHDKYIDEEYVETKTKRTTKKTKQENDSDSE